MEKVNVRIDGDTLTFLNYIAKHVCVYFFIFCYRYCYCCYRYFLMTMTMTMKKMRRSFPKNVKKMMMTKVN